MHRYSKRMKSHRVVIAGIGLSSPQAALEKLQSLEADLPSSIRRCRFDQTVVVSASLGIDSRQADQVVRGAIVLPHGIGKTKRVVVFSQGEQAAVAIAAGADVVGGRDLADKIKAGWLEFDVAIASTDMMGVVGPLGKILGPRGLMPSPKAGTVTQDVGAVVREYKAGKVEFRADSGGNVNCVIGKLSFSSEMLINNLQSFLHYLRTLKPQTSKGQYIRRVRLVCTMTPSIAISI